MKFNELSNKSQNFAILNYIEGWEETHDNNDLSIETTRTILSNRDDIYHNTGMLIEELN